MNYRSVCDLNLLILGWLSRLPQDIDLVAGVPRSGMLVASLIALHRNLPLADVDGLLNARPMGHGRRGRTIDLGQKLRVLVVDDSLNTGDQLLRLKARIAAASLPHEILYAAGYVRPGAEHLVDFCGELLEIPHLFEWNFLHHPMLLGSCLDIDGVLCEDPREDVNDDSERYREFLLTATPLIIPTAPVGWLVTARLEKYRALTEQWLASHGVQYRALIMMDVPDVAARRAAPSNGEYKALAYLSTGADFFIESSCLQAVEIANLSGKPVYCMDTRQIIKPDNSTGVQPLTAAPPEGAFARAGVSPGLSGANNGWTAQLQAAVHDLLAVVPAGQSVLVLDECQWGLERSFAHRNILPFLERDGQYWGPPPDEQTAISELERLRQQGIGYAIIGWPAFWLLDQYPGFNRHLRTQYRCMVENQRLIAFDICQASGAWS